MMKRLTGLLALVLLCAIALAEVKTNPAEPFTNGSLYYVMADSVPACTTYAFSWGKAPLLSLSWNAYGDDGAAYCIGIQWADHSKHFDRRIDVSYTLEDPRITLSAADTTRATAVRFTEQIARPTSQYGRVIAMVDVATNDAAWFVNVDSVRTVQDQ